jgi:two-component system sensor histidine kinase SenX3
VPTVAVALVAVAAGAALGFWIGWRRRVATPAADLSGSPTSTAAPEWPDYTQVLDQLSVGVVIVGRDGAVVYRNRAASALAGTHSGVLVDDAVKRIAHHALQGTPARQTLELHGPPRVAVAVASSPLPGGGAVASIEDETERRRVDAVRTDFVANISHELKTPVGALAVLAETLIGETDSAMVDRMAARMVDEAHRVARTIDDLLELSRIELGEEPIRDPVAVNDIVSSAVERSREYAQQQRIDIAALGVPDDLTVIGDRRQLVSALGNLVENAVKYSEPGSSVQLRVHLPREMVEFMVADNGIGIPPGEHDRIFERFYRVDKARSRNTGGTGLGLAIVRHIATNHAGDVQVSSQEGEGSTFVLRIPGTASASGGLDPIPNSSTSSEARSDR